MMQPDLFDVEVEYDLIETKGDTWAIKLKNTEFVDCIFQYIQLKFEEVKSDESELGDYVVVHSEVKIHEDQGRPAEDFETPEFKIITGSVLKRILEEIMNRDIDADNREQGSDESS